MAKKSQSPKSLGIGSSAGDLIPKAMCFNTPPIIELLNIVTTLWPTKEGEESPGFLKAKTRLHEALRIDETLWQSTGEPIPKNKYEMEVLLARIGENDLVKSGNWTPREVTSLVIGGIKRELSKAKPDFPASHEDKSAYVLISTLWDEDNHFKTQRQCKTFLKKTPSIRTEPKGQRFYVHAGDWKRYWAEKAKDNFENTDKEIVGTFLEVQAKKMAGK